MRSVEKQVQGDVMEQADYRVPQIAERVWVRALRRVQVQAKIQVERRVRDLVESQLRRPK